MRYVTVSLLVALLLVFSFPPMIEAKKVLTVQKITSTEIEKKFMGNWEGMMKQPGNNPFPVKIHLKEFSYGKWSGILQHDDPLNAEGNLLGIKVEGKTMTLAASIYRGRERCLDGLTVLTLIDNNTMERIWIDPMTGKAGAKGRLKRQAN